MAFLSSSSLCKVLIIIAFARFCSVNPSMVGPFRCGRRDAEGTWVA